MQNWFRTKTDISWKNYDTATQKFNSLYNFVKALFGTTYGVLVVSSIFIAIMALMVYAIMLMTASQGREREEAKRRIQNGCIAIVIIFFTLALVTTIFWAFERITRNS